MTRSQPTLPPRGFLTVPEVAKKLGISSSGVHKLIQRGKLKAVKRSERKTLVPEPALRAYIDKLNGKNPSFPSLPEKPVSLEKAREIFISENDQTPEKWIENWKKEIIEDTAKNMEISIHALAIILESSENSI